MFVLSACAPGGKPIPIAKSQFQLLPVRIGRNELNDFCLQFSLVSSFHARIEEVNGRICIRDLGSKNGVFLPGPDGGALVRMQPNSCAELSPSQPVFYLTPHIQVRLAVVAQRAPVRGDGMPSGVVLGNLSIITQPGQAGSQPPPHASPQFRGERPSAPPGFGHEQGSYPAGLGGSGGSPSHGVAFGIDAAGPRQSAPAVEGFGYPGQGSSPPASFQRYPGGIPGAPRLPSDFPLPGAAQPSHHPPAASGGGQGAYQPSPSTQAFQLDLPVMALAGLRELAGSLVPGRKIETTGDLARFITKLHDAVDVFCRTFIPLRKGYSEFITSLDLHQGEHSGGGRRSPATVALEQAKTPEAVAMVLLDPLERSFDGPSAVEGILADLMVHQVAILDGVMEGVRALLDELSPQAIEQAVGSGGAAGLLGGKHRARWEEFCRRFERLSEGQQAFTYVFGKDFSEVYRQYSRRKETGTDGGLRTERPPG